VNRDLNAFVYGIVCPDLGLNDALPLANPAQGIAVNLLALHSHRRDPNPTPKLENNPMFAMVG